MSRNTRLWLLVFVVAAAACGGGTEGGSDSDGGGPTSDDPCSLATAAMVGEAFGGTASDGEAGAARNCGFEIEGGTATHVDVYHYGDSSGWDGTRQGFEDNRSGTNDVSGLGDAAFHPNDMGPSELVVRAGDVIFSVSTGAFGGSGPESEAGLHSLATAIADSLS